MLSLVGAQRLGIRGLDQSEQRTAIETERRCRLSGCLQHCRLQLALHATGPQLRNRRLKQDEISARLAPIKPDDASALLVIDVQNSFLPGGSLAVKDGDQVIPVINRIAKSFANVVMTQDWHTAGHISFASSHPGKKPFEVIDLPYGKQVLWPDHCVQGTEGAALSKDLSISGAEFVVRKGHHEDVDSYSAFTEADGKTTTGLAAYLKARKLQRLFMAGLATDFCVAWTALDARKAGFEAYVIEDACRGIDTQGSMARAWADMAKAGVKRIQSSDIPV